MGEKYYIFVGHAEGPFEVKDGPNKGKKQAFCHMFALTPVSDFASDDYHAAGFKAEKLRCASPAVWKDLTPGELCNLYFDKVVRALGSAGQCPVPLAAAGRNTKSAAID